MIHELSVNTALNPRVLIVDDCIDSVKIMSTILAHYQCDMNLAFDGQDAIPMLQDRSYDLVILDWNMPKMAGNEMLMMMEQILADPKRKKIPTSVLLYTTSHFSDLILPEVKNFRYVGCLNKTNSFKEKFKSIGNTLALL